MALVRETIFHRGAKEVIATCREKLGFTTRVEAFLWCILSFIYLPIGIFFQFYTLGNVITDLHPCRQTQTALTILQFRDGTASLFDYRSPQGGMLWNNVFEFPLYEWVVSKVLFLGFSVEVASRLVTLSCFFAVIAILVRLACLLFGKRVAAWLFIMAMMSPFNLVFSRSILIDFMTQAFALGTVLTFVTGKLHKKVSLFLLTSFTILGVLAASTKVTIWLCPFLAMSLTCAHEIYAEKKVSRANLRWLISLGIQFVAAVAWHKWAGSLREATAETNPNLWIFGTLQSRLDPVLWKNILLSILRSVFYDWMAFPFAAGLLFLWKNHTGYFAAGCTLILLPILVTFNVHGRHDYYLIGEMPYLMLLAACGMAYIFDFSRPTLTPLVLVFIATVLGHRAGKAQYTYGDLMVDHHRGDTEVQLGLSLRETTSPEDIIFSDSFDSSYELAVFGERMVALPERARFLSSRSLASDRNLSASVFILRQENPNFSLLSQSTRVWSELGPVDPRVYRVRDAKAHAFNSSLHMGVLTEVGVPSDAEKVTSWPMRVDLCAGSKASRLLDISGATSAAVKVNSVSTGQEILFPLRAYLSLPRDSRFGCAFEVSLVVPRKK